MRKHEKKYFTKQAAASFGAFTLVEMVVTITILALVFTSVMSVFIYYSTLGAKIEANRLLQSNIKNITEHIDNDIRRNGVEVVPVDEAWQGCIDQDDHCIEEDAMYSDTVYRLNTNDSSYFLGKPMPGAGAEDPWEMLEGQWNILHASEYESECKPVKENCAIVKRTSEGKFIRLSNSWVSFSNLYFYVSTDAIPKVTMNFDMNIASGKEIRNKIVESSSIKIQTTMSERLLDTK